MAWLGCFNGIGFTAAEIEYPDWVRWFQEPVTNLAWRGLLRFLCFLLWNKANDLHDTTSEVHPEPGLEDAQVAVRSCAGDAAELNRRTRMSGRRINQMVRCRQIQSGSFELPYLLV